MVRFQGVMPPAVTIFDSQGKIDWHANFHHADFLLEKGVDGIAYLGTTGEFGALTLEEKRDFVEQMARHVAGRAKVLAGVSDTCLKNVLELSRCCEAAGVDGLLVLPPYFSVYPGKMLAKFYDSVAEHTSLPVILYNFPALTGFDMTPEWVRSLALRHENIVGIKETVPDPEHVAQMLRVKDAREDFGVYAAYDDQFLRAVEMGVDGFIHAAGNFAPEAAVALWEHRKDETAAKQDFARVLQAMDVYAQAEPLYLAVKEAVYLRVLGRRGGERLPACALNAQQSDAVKRILRELQYIA